jgi:hypothetical protein
MHGGGGGEGGYSHMGIVPEELHCCHKTEMAQQDISQLLHQGKILKRRCIGNRPVYTVRHRRKRQVRSWLPAAAETQIPLIDDPNQTFDRRASGLAQMNKRSLGRTSFLPGWYRVVLKIEFLKLQTKNSMVPRYEKTTTRLTHR